MRVDAVGLSCRILIASIMEEYNRDSWETLIERCTFRLLTLQLTWHSTLKTIQMPSSICKNERRCLGEIVILNTSAVEPKPRLQWNSLRLGLARLAESVRATDVEAEMSDWRHAGVRRWAWMRLRSTSPVPTACPSARWGWQWARTNPSSRSGFRV